MTVEPNDNARLQRTISDLRQYISELENLIDIHSAKLDEQHKLWITQVKRMWSRKLPTDPLLAVPSSWTPPPWLKESGLKFIWEGAGCWCASANKPEWTGFCYKEPPATINITAMNFTPPPDIGFGIRGTLIEL